MRRSTFLLLAMPILLLPVAAAAVPSEEVERLLRADRAPTGVVFEVVSGDESQLERVLPAIREHARRLRERYPALPVAVVTHGSEQFSLLAENGARYGDLHALVSAFGKDDGIPVQVCGNHASYRNKGREDFPDYVDVVSAASAKLAEYRKAGYVVIIM